MEKNTSTLNFANYATHLKGFLILLLVALASFTNSYAQPYNLNITIVGSGSVVVDPDQLDYSEGTEVEITATPDFGWAFAEWSEDVTGSDSPLTVTMDSDKNITANFELNSYTLTLQTDGTEGAATTPTGTVEVNHGAETPIEATAPTGYNFTGWTVVGEGTATFGDPTLASTTVTLTDGDATVQANFELNTYNLTLQTDGTEGAATTPTGT
ncbi:MAG: InlB B-repeat-containing protein, partial [Bacteroidales bacterium]